MEVGAESYLVFTNICLSSFRYLAVFPWFGLLGSVTVFPYLTAFRGLWDEQKLQPYHQVSQFAEKTEIKMERLMTHVSVSVSLCQAGTTVSS